MAQLARWLTFIEQFDFDMLHRQGARHGNADGLSRKPIEPNSDDVPLVHSGVGDAQAADMQPAADVVQGSAGEPLTCLMSS